MQCRMADFMKSIDPARWRTARQAHERAVQLYLPDPNVTLVDLGFRIRRQRIEPELAVRVHVRKKLRGTAFQQWAARHPQRVIDSQRVGFAVDVVQADYHLQRRVPESEIGSSILLNQRSRMIGGPVRDRDSGEKMLLGAWHTLEAFEHAEKTAHAVRTRRALHKHLDAAVINFSDRGHPMPVCAVGVTVPLLGMKAIKRDKESSAIPAIITGILGYATFMVNGKLCILNHIVHLASEEDNPSLCAAGDSGAWWVEHTSQRAAGLHFAGSTDFKFALAHSMPAVLTALNVEIIPHRQESTEKAELDIIHFSSHKKRSKKLAALVIAANLFGVLYLVLIAYCERLAGSANHQNKRVNQIYQDFPYVNSVVQVDHRRGKALKKIISIINRYNTGMREELKSAIAHEIYEMNLKYSNLNVPLICATITHESGRTWDPKVISPAGAIGLMQILPRTAASLTVEEKDGNLTEMLVDPIFNIRLGCHLLSKLIEVYQIDGGLAAYNGGEKRAERWLQNKRAHGILHAETALYVPTVLKIYAEFQKI